MKFWLLQQCLVLNLLLRSSVSADGCGKPNDIIDRIVNGRDVGYMKYPWFTTLLLRSSNDRLMCGGSLVGPRHVLTAAHCFKPFLSSADSGRLTLEDVYHAKLGVNNICQSESTQQLFSTSKVYIHENYREKMPYYDIALLELDRDANFTPVCLPAQSLTDATRPEDGVIVGLGKESANAWSLPCKVKEARVLIFNETVCKQMLEDMKEDSSLMTGAFCAGYLQGGIDSCQGDSGGPLQTINPNTGLYELDGVTSFGFGCAEPGVLGVYTDVSQYIDWIKPKIQATSSMSVEWFFRKEKERLNNSYPIDDEMIDQKINNISVPISENIPVSVGPASSAPAQQQKKRRKYHKNPLFDLLNI